MSSYTHSLVRDDAVYWPSNPVNYALNYSRVVDAFGTHSCQAQVPWLEFCRSMSHSRKYSRCPRPQTTRCSPSAKTRYLLEWSSNRKLPQALTEGLGMLGLARGVSANDVEMSNGWGDRELCVRRRNFESFQRR
jgi:hypothetical protein